MVETVQTFNGAEFVTIMRAIVGWYLESDTWCTDSLQLHGSLRETISVRQESVVTGHCHS